MAAQSDHEPIDLSVEQTEGFKVGEKKTLEEYQKLDKEDESLNKWKQSLGFGAASSATADANDGRTCTILRLALVTPKDNIERIVLDLSDQKHLDDVAKTPYVIKDGATYRLKVRFKVQGDVLCGLKYIQAVSKTGITDKIQEMIGSFAPNDAQKPYHEVLLRPEIAPSGMMFRIGHYKAKCRFVDDDDKTHLEFGWSFKIEKDWASSAKAHK